jgi:hypothetical protein
MDMNRNISRCGNIPRHVYLVLILSACFMMHSRGSAEENKSDYPPLTRKEINSLIEDPLAAQPEAADLIRRRIWLAHQGANLDAFRQVATEFEVMGAHYASTELLWFAVRLIPLGKQQDAIVATMNNLLEQSQAPDEELDKIEQLWGAGRTNRAINDLKALSREYPFNEKPHFYLARFYYEQYLAHEKTRVALMARDLRIKFFKICYQQLMLTLALDPLYEDAYYYLGRIRDLLHDEQRFLEQTQWMSSQGLDFRVKLRPAFTRLQDGEFNAENYLEAGEGFEGVGVYPYAVYSYQAALRLTDVGDVMKSELEKRISRILMEKIPLN